MTVTETAGRSTSASQRADATGAPAPLDATRVLADTEGSSALAELVQRLRAVRYDGSPAFATSDAMRADPLNATIVALAGGDKVVDSEVQRALGIDAVTALLRCGALAQFDGGLRLTARVFPIRSVYTLLPGTTPGQDAVYLGPDSLELFQVIWSARGHGDRAVDLATGNGFIAAALATRYDHVIAADLSSRCVATASLVPLLNPHLRSRFSTVQMDVANGLRAGSFDLVTANAPWVPEVTGPDGGPPRRFAAGGPTGFELPRRFIAAAAELLAPRGRAFVACLDIRFDDGRRPLHDHLRRISAAGFEVMINETSLNEIFDYNTWAGRKARGATHAKHVVVELRRPS